jgi:iron complex outermembrane receptor protein
MSLFVNNSWTDDQQTEALNLAKNQPGERLESYGLLNPSFDRKGINDSNIIYLLIFAANNKDELYRTSNSGVYQTGSLGAWSTLYGEPGLVGARLRYNWGGQDLIPQQSPKN